LEIDSASWRRSRYIPCRGQHCRQHRTGPVFCPLSPRLLATQTGPVLYPGPTVRIRIGPVLCMVDSMNLQDWSSHPRRRDWTSLGNGFWVTPTSRIRSCLLPATQTGRVLYPGPIVRMRIECGLSAADSMHLEDLSSLLPVPPRRPAASPATYLSTVSTTPYVPGSLQPATRRCWNPCPNLPRIGGPSPRTDPKGANLRFVRRTLGFSGYLL
jgi:hypothetical protein